MTFRTPGERAYETERAIRPNYHDGTPRPPFAALSAVAQLSWERDPTWRTNDQRRQLRELIRGGRTMNEAESYRRQGVIGVEAFRRFERLWAVSTATEHRYTAKWSLERWRSRRARVREAVQAFLQREGAA